MRRHLLLALALVGLIGLSACEDDEHFVDKEEPDQTVVAPGELEAPGAQDTGQAGESAGEAAEAPEQVDKAGVAADSEQGGQ